MNAIVECWTSSKTKLELKSLLGGLVPFGPLNSAKDIFEDPHVMNRSMIEEMKFSNSEARPWRVAGNPLNFSKFPQPKFSFPPRLGETKVEDLYKNDPEPLSEKDKNDLRSAFGTFATGVTVVTTNQKDGVPRGFTANSFSSVSLDPPMLLVCIAKTAQSFEIFRDSKCFAINVLSEKQRAVAGLFSLFILFFASLFSLIGNFIADVLDSFDNGQSNEDCEKTVFEDVKKLCSKFPIY